jgi:hypothetical protein
MAQYGVSFVAHVLAYDSTAGTLKTGDAANIILYWDKDGTNSLVSSNSGVPTEVSSTNSPGLYKITISAAEATCTTGRLSGKSSTGTNIIITGPEYHFDSWSSVIPAGGVAALGHVDAGTLQAATATTARLRSAAAFADSELVGHTLWITSNTGVGQSRIITAYSAATDACTVDTWTTTPDNTSTYIVYPTPPGSVTSPVPAKVYDSSGNYGIKKNTALTAFPFLMTDSTTHAPATGLTVTATRSIDGAAFGACANSVAEIANGWYKITLAAADLNGNTIALKFTATGADQNNITIVTAP